MKSYAAQVAALLKNPIKGSAPKYSVQINTEGVITDSKFFNTAKAAAKWRDMLLKAGHYAIIVPISQRVRINAIKPARKTAAHFKFGPAVKRVNPVAKKAKRWYCVDQVQNGKWYQIAVFKDKARAFEYAKACVKSHGGMYQVVKAYPGASSYPVKTTPN